MSSYIITYNHLQQKVLGNLMLEVVKKVKNIYILILVLDLFQGEMEPMSKVSIPLATK